MVTTLDTRSVLPLRAARALSSSLLRIFFALLALAAGAVPALAQEQGGGEANLHLPDLRVATFLGGINGHNLLLGGLLVSALGLVFGLVIFVRLRNMPVHTCMREVSELIYETCKTYLATQGKFLMVLEIFIAVIIVFYFGLLQGLAAYKVIVILLFSVIGISGLRWAHTDYCRPGHIRSPAAGNNRPVAPGYIHAGIRRRKEHRSSLR